MGSPVKPPERPRPLETARRLVALGLSVIPTNPWDKLSDPDPQTGEVEPLGKKAGVAWKGYRDRVATDDELRGWFSGGYGGRRNVAIVCGALSGLVVVDADSVEAIQWVRAHLPATPWEVNTGKGVHFYYAHPGVPIANGCKVRVLEGDERLDLDVRGDRGYVLGPDSIHPSGRLYVAIGDWSARPELPAFDPAWVRRVEPVTSPAPPPPAAARPATSEGGNGWALDGVERAWRFMRSVPTRKAGEGRNQARFVLACALVRGFNLPDDEAFRALQDWNSRCPGPVSDTDLVTSIKNAHTSGGEAYGARLAQAPREPLRRAGGAGAGRGSAPRPDGPSVAASASPEPPDVEWGGEDTAAAGGGPPWCDFKDPLIVHKGEPRRWAGNLAKILRQDKRWGSRLRLNEMSQDVMYDGRGDGHLKPIPVHFADLVQEHIENTYELSFSRDEVANKITAQAVESPYHPVRRYLQELPEWDRVERIEFIPAEVLGTEDGMAPLYMRRFCVGAVRRALEPGCKLDTAVVLVGAQGKRKSTFWRTLAGPEFFSDTPVELESKDRFFQVNAAWVVEMAEIDGMNSTATAEAVKAFLSSQKDTFRPPYGRTPITLYRSSVCVGTTNRGEFLHDVTGSRRFWPVPIDLPADEEINLELLALWRDQVWAEALHYWREGEPHWLSKEEEARRVSSSSRFEAEDAWEGILDQALKALKRERLVHRNPEIKSGPFLAPSVMPEDPPATLADGWTVGEVLLKMNIPAAQHTKSMTQRVTGLLRKRGWTRQYVTVAGDRRWRWYDPADVRASSETA